MKISGYIIKHRGPFFCQGHELKDVVSYYERDSRHAYAIRPIFNTDGLKAMRYEYLTDARVQAGLLMENGIKVEIVGLNMKVAKTTTVLNPTVGETARHFHERVEAEREAEKRWKRPKKEKAA